MAFNHSRKVLAAIIPQRRDLLVEAMQWLTEDHFTAEPDKVLWRLLVRFYDQTAEVVSREIFVEMLSRLDVEPARAIAWEQLYTQVEVETVDDATFRYSYQELRRIRADQLTAEALTDAMEILTRGKEVDGEMREGYQAAWSHAMDVYGQVNAIGSEEVAPEGDMMTESSDILHDYSEREAARMSGTAVGVLTGIPSIDHLTSGLQPGDLALVCAYTGAGKSMFVAQTAWCAAVRQHLNVFFVTSETTRAMTRRRIVARHSLEEKFNYPQGINSKDLKNGTLSNEAKAKFVEVATDLDTNGTYGALYIAQVPHDATLSAIESRITRFAQTHSVGLVVIDYLALLHSDRRRDHQTAEFTDLLKSAKMLATTFNRGNGVAILSPWAMNRDRFLEAKKTGHYTLGSLADTSEAEKSPDVLVSMLRPEDDRSKVTMQFLKNRDGEVGHAFSVDVKFRNTYLGEEKAGEGFDKMLHGD